MSLFDDLNAPFPYSDYKYNEDDDRVYINGQAVAERLNQVLGVGYWSYEPFPDTVKKIDTGKVNKAKEKIFAIVLLVNFKFYNKDLGEWITFTDAGSQELNRRMGEGDGTKSAITDGLKKCASRIGVASDLYKGLVTAKNKKVILPDSYKEYYQEKNWKGLFVTQGGGVVPLKTKTETKTETKEEKILCSNPDCGREITKEVRDYSVNTFQKVLCIPCQKIIRKNK